MCIRDSDTEIKEIIVADNDNIGEFVEKLDKANIHYSTLPLANIPVVDVENTSNRYTVLIYLMELGLHRNPKELKKKIYETVEVLTPYSSGILLFYGLCGNVLGNIETDFAANSLSCPVHILKDNKERIVDCLLYTSTIL